MKRTTILVIAMMLLGTTALFGEQPQGTKSQDSKTAAAAAPSNAATSAPVRRTYRSYSVRPSTRAPTVSRSYHASHATWRHGDSKATGQYHSGR